MSLSCSITGSKAITTSACNALSKTIGIPKRRSLLGSFLGIQILLTKPAL
jgi:hypothetical protein